MTTRERRPAGRLTAEQTGRGLDQSVQRAGDVRRGDAMAAAALRYAAAGWPVFPCLPGRAEPMTRHGCLDATTDPAVITRWWTQVPSANVAIATGAPGPDVVDIDVKDGRAGMRTLDRLRVAGLLAGPSALVRTPSGGLHLYYRGSGQRNGAMARHGVDFRGAGGYVLAPPSRRRGHDGRGYELLDHRGTGRGVDWSAIRRYLDPPRPRRACSDARPGDLSRLVRWLAQQPAGNRNEGLFWAARKARDAGIEDLAPLVDAAVTAGLPAREAERTIRSVQQWRGVAA